MKIQNKKTGEFYDVTKKEWAFMKERGSYRKYDVVDDRELSHVPEKIEAVEIKPLVPEETVSHGILEVEKVDENEKNELREKLDELGVKYHPKTGLEKLRQKLKEATDEG